MDIAIYDGEGTSQVLRKSLFSRFHQARPVYPKDLERGLVCDVFVMPGGRDRLYHAALSGTCNQQIRAFVEQGGTYLGICGGAYYGSRFVDFERGGPLEVLEERELCFFPGKAVGPAYGLNLFAYDSEKGARVARLDSVFGKDRAYYNGGCTFEGDLKEVEILANYADIEGNPPAVIACRVGKGKAILSGVHLEVRGGKILDGLLPHPLQHSASDQMKV